jgi:Phosphodiester glycosidase
MSIRGRARRPRAAIARVLAIIALALVPAAAAEPASAACPGFTSLGVSTWVEDFNARGVQLCRGDNGGVQAYMTIIDLAAGAKVRLVSQTASGQSPGTPATDWRFNKRTVRSWWDYFIANVGIPSSSRQLFSVTNGSFFIDTESATSTPMSLPHVTGASIRTHGWALGHQGDFAWNAPKRYLRFGHPGTTPQSVAIGTFPTHYTPNDIATFLLGYDGTVGYEPLYCSNCGPARRNMLGKAGNKLYLITTSRPYLLSEVQAIIQQFAGGLATTVQLDGGGSSQMYSRHGEIVSCAPPLCGVREVPEALGVFMAP